MLSTQRLGEDWDVWIAHDDTCVVVAHHFVVRGGRIVRFEQFVDTARARDAMPI